MFDGMGYFLFARGFEPSSKVPKSVHTRADPAQSSPRAGFSCLGRESSHVKQQLGSTVVAKSRLVLAAPTSYVLVLE